MPQRQIISAPIETTVTDRITRNMKRNQEISRLALGEISNRVCGLAIDASKDKLKAQGQRANSKVTSKQDVKANISSKHNSNPNNKQVSRPTTQCKIVIPKVKQSQSTVHAESCPTELPLPYDSSMPPSAAVVNESLEKSTDISSDALSRNQLSQQVKDIDKDNETDPQLVSCYVNDVYSYLRHLEKKFSIRKNLLQSSDITGKMRAVLIDWLCRVHCKFQLLQETFFMTVAIVDRYLQVKPCRRSRLQLVGVTAMLVASKYEEMYAPEVGDFAYITDDAYTKQDIRDMEQDILHSLDYSLGRPHCLHFLRRYSKAGEVSSTVRTLAKYLIELATVEYELVHITPSHVAAASLYLSMFVLDGSSWSQTLQFYSSYSVNDLRPVVHSLAQIVVKTETSKLTAVKAKYSTSELFKIAQIPQLKSKPFFDLTLAQT